MNMLGSILSAGVVRPGGLPAPTGEGADGAAAGLGEMFAAVIAAASAPAVGEAGAEGVAGGASVAMPGAAIAGASSTATETDPALVTELTLAVLGNGGVAKGEAQSLPTPEPLPEKRVLALAPEGQPDTAPGAKPAKSAGKTPTPVLFDQPVLTKALGAASDQPVIAEDSGIDAVTTEDAEPVGRSAKGADADTFASPSVQSAPMMTAAVAQTVPPVATPPAQTQVPVPQAVPALTVTAQRKSIGAYRAGQSSSPAQAPAQSPGAGRPARPTPIAGQETAPLAMAAVATAVPTSATGAPPAELVARIVADTLRPAGSAAAVSPPANRPRAIAASADAEAPVVTSDSATGSIVPAIALTTPSPLRASRPSDALRQQPVDAGIATAPAPATSPATSPAAAPAVAAETARDTQRADTGEAVVAAPAAAGPSGVIPAAIAAPAIDGTARIEASAPAAPQLGAVLSDQVIDMGIDGQWIDRLAREITQVADGTGHSRFQLMPPNLGRIQVDLWQGEAGGRVHLLTETDEAAMRLREGQSTLQADARLAALSLGQVVIERAAGGNLDGQRDPNAQSNPQPQSQPRGQDQAQTAQQNGQQHQGQPQAGGQNAAGSGASQGQSGNNGGQHGKSGDQRAVLEDRGQDAGTTTGGESRVRYA